MNIYKLLHELELIMKETAAIYQMVRLPELDQLYQHQSELYEQLLIAAGELGREGPLKVEG
jgi:hypothetical protein